MSNNSVFLSILASTGLPMPETEYRFHPSRKWRFDYAWPDQRIALEVEGGVWTQGRHTRGKGFLGDMDKYNEAAVDGWRILRCQPNALFSRSLLDLLGRIFAIDKD